MKEQEETYEQLNDSGQRIYVASLSDYNDGRLYGRWINADQDPDCIDNEVRDMLKGAPTRRAEEWAIHDYEGFGAFHLSEYESLIVVARIAQGIGDHGPAFAHWVNLVGTADNEALDDFEDYYRGVWSSIEAYAEDMLEDLGATVKQFGPAWLQPYIHIDYQQFGQALASDLDTAEDEHGVHIFEVRQ